MSDDERKPKDLYDASAAKWVRTQPTSLSDFTGRPATLALCEPVAGKRVLDLGCGEGYCTRALKRAGAASALGIDISDEMIRAAQGEEQRAPLGIEYRQGDCTMLEGVPDGSVDVVLAMFMYNYMSCADTERSMREARRVLRPPTSSASDGAGAGTDGGGVGGGVGGGGGGGDRSGGADGGGVFVFAVPHPSLPFLRKPGEQPFFFDAGGAGYFGGRDRRFAGRIWKRDGTALDVQAVHKTVEDYFAALAGAGFTALPVVRELHATAAIKAVDPAFFGPLGETPLHLAVRIAR